jgi:mycothiol synthase
MGFEIHQVDTQTAPDALLEELSDYYDLIEAEDIPGDPPTPVEVRIAEWRHPTAHHPEFHWILRDDDGIAAMARASYDVEQNLENGFGRVHVHPEKRRRGYGRALATPVLDLLEESGRRRFATSVNKDDPAEAVVARLGLKRVYEDKRSRLTIAELDLDLMDVWIERAPERAGDYELVYVPSPIPDEIVQKFCDLTAVMNTAPREDYQEEDEILTPQRWRDLESSVIDAKCQLHHLIAVHQPTGDFAGYTQIETLDLQPDLAWQWDTGVDPAHRNKGLGRWLKASLIRRVIAGHPQVTRVDTFNAGSNEPMLNINVEMGFRPIHIAYDWQGDLAAVRERLGA